ncbi:MAG: hypothetical protein ACPGSH_04520 [Ilumatobacteraceae bacterium]
MTKATTPSTQPIATWAWASRAMTACEVASAGQQWLLLRGRFLGAGRLLALLRTGGRVLATVLASFALRVLLLLEQQLQRHVVRTRFGLAGRLVQHLASPRLLGTRSNGHGIGGASWRLGLAVACVQKEVQGMRATSA